MPHHCARPPPKRWRQPLLQKLEALATAVTHLVPLLPSAGRSNLLARLYAERGGLLIWRNLAAVAWRLGDFSMAQEYCSRSLALHQQAGDVRGENRARHFLAMIASNQQQYTETERLLAPVLQSAQEIGDRRILVGADAELGLIASYRGEFELALTYLAQERRLADELGVPYQAASSLSNTGDLRLKVGDFVGPGNVMRKL